MEQIPLMNYFFSMILLYFPILNFLTLWNHFSLVFFWNKFVELHLILNLLILIYIPEVWFLMRFCKIWNLLIFVSSCLRYFLFRCREMTKILSWWRIWNLFKIAIIWNSSINHFLIFYWTATRTWMQNSRFLMSLKIIRVDLLMWKRT